MQVILLKKVKNVGEAGEIKDVADGFARNFLLAGKLAVPASAENLRRLAEEQAQRARVSEKELVAVEQLGDRLAGTAVEIRAKANDEGRLYAAITNATLAKKLQELGFAVKKEQIKLVEPIKEAGEYPIVVSLPHGLEAEINLIVEIL